MKISEPTLVWLAGLSLKHEELREVTQSQGPYDRLVSLKGYDDSNNVISVEWFHSVTGVTRSCYLVLDQTTGRYNGIVTRSQTADPIPVEFTLNPHKVGWTAKLSGMYEDSFPLAAFPHMVAH